MERDEIKAGVAISNVIAEDEGREKVLTFAPIALNWPGVDQAASRVQDMECFHQMNNGRHAGGGGLKIAREAK